MLLFQRFQLIPTIFHPFIRSSLEYHNDSKVITFFRKNYYLVLKSVESVEKLIFKFFSFVAHLDLAELRN